MKIKLVGAKRYNTNRGERFEAEKVYEVSDEQGEELLASVDEWDNPYFEEASSRDEKNAGGVSKAVKPKDDAPGGKLDKAAKKTAAKKAAKKTIKVGGGKPAAEDAGADTEEDGEEV